MKVVVAGHITIDTIISQRFETRSLGGPPCYAGLTARIFGLDVALVTKIGYDFPDDYILWISRNQLNLQPGFRSLSKPTTKFQITYPAGGRQLTLLDRCEDLNVEQLADCKGDGIIISPVAGEIPADFVKACLKTFRPLYLDPQGFLRHFSPNGKCTLTQMDANLLRGVDFLKMDEEESYQITGVKDPIQAFTILRRLGVKNGIATRGSEGILILVGGSVYQIPRASMAEVLDATGAGDIFGGAFLAAFIKEMDPLWSACVASAASSLALGRIALAKIPEIDKVLELAENLSQKTIKIAEI